MQLCYNCGNEFPEENITREHIPAQNLFVGYGNEYKVNRLVVPACFECNNQYSQIDQEIRDAIGVMNNHNDDQIELTRKSIKSIMRQKNWADRLHFSDGKVLSVNFSYDDLKKLHIKNFKGVFYAKYKRPLPKDFEVEIIAEGDEENEKLMGIGKLFYDYVVQNDEFLISGHEDIFMYNIKTMNPTDSEYVIDNGDVENSLCVIGVFVYHKNLCSIVIASKKEFLDRIRQKKR
jgi:hypothetical protein